MNRQQQGFTLFVFAMLLWMMLPDSEDQAQSLILTDLATRRLEGFRTAWEILRETQWGDFAPRLADDVYNSTGRYLNLTGFREEDGLAWEDLERFRRKGLDLSHWAFVAGGGWGPWELGKGDPVWRNASGALRGDWVRKPGSVIRGYDSYNLSNSVPSMEWINDEVGWARNNTGDSGRMILMLEGNKTLHDYEQLSTDNSPLSGGVIKNIKGTLMIEDTTGSGSNWDMRLWGNHWPQQGVIIMTTTSEKFDGIFGLPHLTPSADYFQSSQMLLNKTLDRTLTRKEKNVNFDQNIPWNSDSENPVYTKTPSPHCEYVIYAQIHPPTRQDLGLKDIDLGLIDHDTEAGILAEIIHAMETELDHPLGVPFPRTPELKMSAVIYSPDCGFFLETKGPPDFPPGERQHLFGMKKEVHLRQAKHVLLCYAMLLFAQIYLLKAQLKETCTPSTINRLSFATFSTMTVMDGMAAMASATWIQSAGSTLLPTLAVMFAACISATTGGRVMAQIHELQISETRRQNRDRPATGSGRESLTQQPSASPPQETNTGGLLPGPITAGRPVQAIYDQPIIIPSDQDIDAEIAEVTGAAAALPLGGARQGIYPTFQQLLGRYILFSLAISALIVFSSTWDSRFRCALHNFLASMYLSLWIPQIYRNVMRNCRRALRWQFVIGQSILRILPIAYFWVKEDNFLYARTDPSAFILHCAWLWIQVLFLAAQDIIGPRFCVPESWTPLAWDYHPVLRDDNLEAGGLPIGLVADGLESKDGHAQTDCAICREILEVPVVKADEAAGNVAGAFARRMYMVTPCRHIFHTACLEGWLKFRLQCPICREDLPAL